MRWRCEGKSKALMCTGTGYDRGVIGEGKGDWRWATCNEFDAEDGGRSEVVILGAGLEDFME